ncbi:MAG: 1-deoxy-D-xylulose-5-phosphate reductoisomerase [Oscillospiraceae bacterium]|jgi:1-deoxy-D-xylulose-5-phosphate reductoisomerase|nr:1-deoxy-D-xylulose-5-phosphate reductoisomerase [Oscillospiraceae bacterium]
MILLGSTGSVGRQTLDVVAALSRGFPAVLAAGTNDRLMEEQARRFRPKLVCLEDEAAGRRLKTALADMSVAVRSGAESIVEAAAYPGADTVLNALSGVRGLRPTLAALDAGKKLLLANKESLVCGGSLVMKRAKRGIIPVDSEHSAVFQCLGGRGTDSVKKVVLTASGGAFRGFSRKQLEGVTPEVALRHPTWTMGPKITVDSATLLNKGFELIEAMALFGLPFEKVGVVLHPESIIHSLVEYTDGAVLAQLANPDMRLPIQYALTCPDRMPSPVAPLDLAKLGTLTFAEPDRDAFRCLTLAERAAKAGGNMGAALCGAGEAAVESFLAGKTGFLGIEERIERALIRIPFIAEPTISDILDTVELSRQTLL